jgi:tRNA(adenine34) deaminase
MALLAYKEDEVPVGAVLVDSAGEVVSKCYNKKEQFQNVTAHAEILCINQASKKNLSWRLDGYSLYTTLEPCLMCAGAIIAARISRVVCASLDFKGGAESCAGLFTKVHTNHNVDFVFYDMLKAKELLQSFFRAKRK